MGKIVLKAGKDKSIFRYHPWIFSGAVQSKDADLVEGDIVKVYGADGKYLATGHYQIGSIAIRVLSFEDIEINQEFWNERILPKCWIPVLIT